MFLCKGCGRTYKYSRNLAKHAKKCARAQAKVDAVEKLTLRVEEQQREIEGIRKNGGGESNSGGNSNNSYVRGNGNVVVNIRVEDRHRRNYSDTNYDVLSEQDIMRAVGHASRCIQEIIPMTHFNARHPENQNIYVSSLKSPVTMLYEGNQWSAHKWATIADRVVDDNVTTIAGWVEQHKDEHPRLAEKFRVFVEQSAKNSRFIEDVKSEVRLILYNNRKLVRSGPELPGGNNAHEPEPAAVFAPSVLC
jgi:hypothetical protein